MASSSGGHGEVIDITARHISKRVRDIPTLGDDDLELEGRSIASYGLDSMVGAEMRTWLFKEFGLDLPVPEAARPDPHIFQPGSCSSYLMLRTWGH